jgi:4-hydroxybenzoate polyprenyltransferase
MNHLSLKMVLFYYLGKINLNMSFILLSPFRVSHWWNYIFPPILAVVYFVCFFQQNAYEEIWLQLALFFISFLFTASFGFFFNDLCDIEADKKADKPNFAAKLSVYKRYLVLILLIVFAVSPWFFLKNIHIAKYFYFLQIILLFAYSLPYIRLKSKIFAAVLTDALYSSLLPALIALFLFTQGILVFEIIRLFILYSIILFFRGLRNILSHQIADAENDQKAGIATFALRYGKDNSLKVSHGFVIAESIGIIAFTILISLEISYWLSLIIPAFLIYFVLKRFEIKNINKSKFIFTQIINDFYEDILPLIFLILLSFNDYYFVIILIIHLVLFKNKFLYTLVYSFLCKSLFYAFIYRKLLLWLYYNPAKWLYYKAFHNKYIKNMLNKQ